MLFTESFVYCDDNHDGMVIMEELISCEEHFLKGKRAIFARKRTVLALNRPMAMKLNRMEIGDTNNDGKLQLAEWALAGAMWDLAFGKTMVSTLGKGHLDDEELNEFAIYKILGLVGKTVF